ncbi:MAG: DUF4738 domain-containing protein [Prevotella sp.]|jgi:hypothetical protein|nr:DUF4738 domain-containing protein [Prevotella sp.]
MMRNPLLLSVCVAALALAVTSCKEKKKSEDIFVAKYVTEELKAPISLRPDVRSTSVAWLEKEYTVTVQRAADDSLPKLKDETGQLYVDNKVTISVERSNKTSFLKKTFTKKAFASYVDNDFFENGYLENIVFQGIDDNKLKFGAAISRPGSEDEFVPLDMWIDRNGKIDIKQGQIFDINEEHVDANEQEGV